MTLKGAKQKLKENKDDTENNFTVIARLQEIKDLLLDIKDAL